MKVTFTAFSVAALLATTALTVSLAGHSHSHGHSEAHLHVPLVLQPYNEDGSLGEPIAVDLSPEDNTVD